MSKVDEIKRLMLRVKVAKDLVAESESDYDKPVDGLADAMHTRGCARVHIEITRKTPSVRRECYYGKIK